MFNATPNPFLLNKMCFNKKFKKILVKNNNSATINYIQSPFSSYYLLYKILSFGITTGDKLLVRSTAGKTFMYLVNSRLILCCFQLGMTL